MNSDKVASASPTAGLQEEISLGELFGLLIEGRWTLVITVLLFAGLGVFYSFVTTPVFQADAMVQVETEGSSLNAALGDVAELLSSETPVTAEIEILRSRMVIGKVVDALKLDIVAVPRFFPVIGKAISRHRDDLEAPAGAPVGLRKFAWGGEVIDVASLEVSRPLIDVPLVLRATASGYDLYDREGGKMLSGEVGKPAQVNHPVYGPVTLFVRDLKARQGTEFRLIKRDRADAIDRVADKLVVTERGKQSGIISLSFVNPQPETVREVINGLVTAYQRQNVERRSAEAEQTLQFLKDQLPALKERVESAEAALNKFRLQQGSADLTKETELVLQQSVELETQRVALLQKREEALRRFTSSHPVVQALDAQMRQIGGEQSQIYSRVKDLPETQQALLSLSRDVEVNTELYTALLNSSQELQVAKAGTVGNVRIIDYALEPLKPAKPNKPLIILASMVLGSLFGAGLVFVRRALRRGVEDPAIVEQQVGLPTYAAIPFVDEQRRISRGAMRGTREGDAHILALADPSNLAVEAMRSLRTSLHFALLESSNNIVMLTGPSPNLGKSFISINLAAVLAMSGKRVVVVDADLRRGQLHEALSFERAPGVSDYVVGDVELSQIMRKTPIDTLTLITTGTVPPNPAELVLHERFADMLKKLSEEYDHVIVDTPPILAVTDAAVIGRLAGCTLLVLKAGEHPLRAIEESVQRLRQGGAQVRGTLFNQVGVLGRYGYSYGYGYRYGYSYSYKSVE